MYTNEEYKQEIKKFIKRQGYNPISVARETFEIFLNQGRFFNKKLNDDLIYIFTMEEGPEYEMTEKEFNDFLDKM